MNARLVRIGNSQGVRLPQTLVQAYRLGPDLTLEATPEGILIRAATRPRQGWSEALAAIPASDRSESARDVEGLPPTAFDAEDWQW